jgi:uncharacterized membrane protein YcgQ (UPF0703/DUF1980 family)
VVCYDVVKYTTYVYIDVMTCFVLSITHQYVQMYVLNDKAWKLESYTKYTNVRLCKDNLLKQWLNGNTLKLDSLTIYTNVRL